MKLETLFKMMPLVETLEAHFDSPLTWAHAAGNILSADGKVNGDAVHLKIQVLPQTIFNGLTVLNLSFASVDPNAAKFVEYAHGESISSLKIFGAVKNAFVDKLDELHYDFAIAIVKDDLKSRKQLYSILFKRMAKATGLVNLEYICMAKPVFILCEKRLQDKIPFMLKAYENAIS